MKLAHDMKPQLDKYELISVLGHGGMATVYLARDRRLGRNVAVKIIHPHLRDDLEIGARFVREARVVAKLHHPNIVEVFDVSEPGELERYLVVELVEGSSLRKFLAENGRMPAEIAAAMAIEILKDEGLAPGFSDTVFDMSVGYDLAGIRHQRIDIYFDNLFAFHCQLRQTKDNVDKLLSVDLRIAPEGTE